MSLMKIFIMTLLISGCATACKEGIPSMDKEVQSWKALSSEQGLKRKKEIIRADEPEFDNFVCYKIEDNAVIQNYILKLIKSCRVWEDEVDPRAIEDSFQGGKLSPIHLLQNNPSLFR
jgi:hypothetical protein